MSGEPSKPKLRIPRPGSLAPEAEEAIASELDTAALLLGLESTLDRDALEGAARDAQHDVHFQAERPAKELLHERELVAEQRSRAEWFEREAEVHGDEAAKVRQLLVASELWATLGELERAEAVAARAQELDADVGLRQRRQLAHARGDSATVRQLLAEEVENAANHDERAHAAFYLAEIERLEGDSAAQAVRYLDIGQRLRENDPRAVLFKLARQLGQSPRSPGVKWPEAKELEPLRFATSVAAHLRGERQKPGATEQGEPLLAFFDAQQAAARGKPLDAGRALSGLFLEPELGPAARWVAAALLAPDPESRDEAVSALEELLDIQPSSHLRRTVAARSLEAGRVEAAEKALSEEDADEDGAFSNAERIAIGALTAETIGTLEPWLEAARQNDKTRVLVWATLRALGGEADFDVGASRLSSARLEMARLLSERDLTKVSARLASLRQSLPHEPLLKLLELEFAHREGRVEDVARGILELVPEEAGEQRRTAHYAAGLLLERAGATEDAASHYERAFDSLTFGEAALRAVQLSFPGRAKDTVLAEIAQRTAHPEHKDALLLETALPLLGESDPEGGRKVAEAALQRLLPTEPRHPLTQLLVERRLAQHGDKKALASELEARLDRATAPFEGALVRVRLARLRPSSDQVAVWLAEALRAWPKDPALVGEYERTNQPNALESAKLREQLAESAKTPWSRARLRLAAAQYYEQGGARSEAARAARESDTLASSELAKICFARNALFSEQAPLVTERWVSELQTAPEAIRTTTCLRLAAFERQNDRWEAEREWLWEAEQASPGRVDILLELELLTLRQKQRNELLRIESALAEALGARDRSAHALLAARRERVQRGWSLAYPLLQKAAVEGAGSLYTLRQLQAHARRAGDDTATLELSRTLVAQNPYPGDRTILALRIATSEVRLGRRERAEAELRAALEVMPDQVLLHHALITTLNEGDAEGAALAHEGVARTSRVAKHQAEAWYDAASAWLERVGNVERGVAALQRAAELDPTHSRVFERLFRLLKDRSDFAGLCRLVEQRIGVVTDKEERLELGMLHSELLRDSGEKARSRAALERLLEERPDHLVAWQRLAELSLDDGDAKAAEKALLQLARLTTNRDEQASAYLLLGNLYRNDLANLERAERCYQEVLRRQPQHQEARTALLPLYLQHNELAKAKKQFEEVLASLPGQAEQRVAFLEHLGMVERHAVDQSYKTELLEQALALWPLDPEVVDLMVRHYAAEGRTDQLEAFESQTFDAVSRKLQAGFLDPKMLQATAALCVAKGEVARARLMQAMAASLQGQLLRLPPLHGQAMQRSLDDRLAPAPMVSPLRTLLMLTRDVLENAFVATGYRPIVQRADTPLAKRVKTTASQAAVPSPTVCIDATVPLGCWLSGGKDMQLVFGEQLSREASNEELDFLIWRSLKLAQARAGVFTRLDATQAKLATVAFLSCFVDVNLASDWDRAEIERVKARIAPLIPKDLDDDVPVLALDALQSLTKSGEHLAMAARKWANRTAVLATGNLNAAFAALLRLAGQALSNDPETRARQLADNPETRDLVSAALLPGMAEALAERR